MLRNFTSMAKLYTALFSESTSNFEQNVPFTLFKIRLWFLFESFSSQESEEETFFQLKWKAYHSMQNLMETRVVWLRLVTFRFSAFTVIQTVILEKKLKFHNEYYLPITQLLQIKINKIQNQNQPSVALRGQAEVLT